MSVENALASAARIAVRIRAEQDGDSDAVRAVNTSAFDTPVEAGLVDTLRKQAHPVVSLVAEEGGTIVGHAMFSPVILHGRADLLLMGLAPMAVVPQNQHRGVGSALVRAGLEKCHRLGCGAVVVLGHPGYYPRFGFVPAASFGLECEYDAPEEAFMALELCPGYLRAGSGRISYHAAFAAL